MNNKSKYDVVIIGGGPAGLTAALYSGRANQSTLFIEKDAPGGKMVKTFKIENWIGDLEILGPDLSMKMFNHAQKYAKYMFGNVVDIKSHNAFSHDIICESGEIINAKSIIIATGTKEKIPQNIKNIKEFENKGVSYCAICDGPLFKNLPMAVIGGGNSAIEESIYLSSIASRVDIFIRKDHARADENLMHKIKGKSNVFIHYKSQILEIIGQDQVQKIKTKINDVEKEMQVSAIFPYIGLYAVTNFLHKLNITNENGYIITNKEMETSIPGIYAVGDVREKTIRQITTAVSDGAIAGKNVANR